MEVRGLAFDRDLQKVIDVHGDSFLLRLTTPLLPDRHKDGGEPAVAVGHSPATIRWNSAISPAGDSPGRPSPTEAVDRADRCDLDGGAGEEQLLRKCRAFRRTSCSRTGMPSSLAMVRMASR